MAKPQIPPNTIFLKWGRLQLVASGHLAISAVLTLGALGALARGGRAFGWW
jgi:hypothetical protein